MLLKKVVYIVHSGRSRSKIIKGSQYQNAPSRHGKRISQSLISTGHEGEATCVMARSTLLLGAGMSKVSSAGVCVCVCVCVCSATLAAVNMIFVSLAVPAFLEPGRRNRFDCLAGENPARYTLAS